MIDKKLLQTFVEQQLEGSDCFLVDMTISADNIIKIEIDSDSSVDIDRCINLTHAIEQEFDREKEDYELEVGSAGLTSPLRLPRQFRKYMGEELEVVADDGKKYRGELTDVTDEGITIVSKEKIKKEGAKRPELTDVTHEFSYDKIRKAEYMIQF